MLTLIVPGLIWTRQALADLTGDLPLPAFTALLGRGSLTRHPPQGSTELLAAAAGIAPPLPAAALRWLALRDHPGTADWLCLDPVRLNFHERGLIVDDPRHLQLSEEEGAALAMSLAPTLAELGRLEVLAPDCWNLRLHTAAPAFQDLREAIGRAAVALPPHPAYVPWRKAISEAQMVLHAHPVTQARAAAGKPVVNSLWPWGGGRLPAPDSGVDAVGHDTLWSDDAVAQGIARLRRIDVRPLPARYAANAWRMPLATIDALESPARRGDALAWREQLSWLEAAWLAPVQHALGSGRLDALRLIAPGDAGTVELRVDRRDLWKFWRKPAAVTALGLA